MEYANSPATTATPAGLNANVEPNQRPQHQHQQQQQHHHQQAQQPQQHVQLQQHYKEQQQQHENQQQFCLRWHNHQTSLLSTLPVLLDQSHLTDVSIAAEGRTLRAHRVVLSACSTFFFELFPTLESGTHPVIIIPGASFAAIVALLTFMYSGEVNVYEEQIPVLLNLAETLGIKGLADVQHNNSMKSVPCTDLLHTHLQREPDLDIPPPATPTPTPPPCTAPVHQPAMATALSTVVAPPQMTPASQSVAAAAPSAQAPLACALPKASMAPSPLSINLLAAAMPISQLHSPLASHLLGNKLPNPLESFFLKSLQLYPGLLPPPTAPQPLNFSQTALNKTTELLAKYQQQCNFYQGALGSLTAKDLLPQLSGDDFLPSNNTPPSERAAEEAVRAFTTATAAKRMCVAEKKQQNMMQQFNQQQQQHHTQQQQQKDIKRLDRIVESLRCGNAAAAAAAAAASGCGMNSQKISPFHESPLQHQQHSQQQQQQQQQRHQQHLLAAYNAKPSAAFNYSAAMAAAAVAQQQQQQQHQQQQREGGKLSSATLTPLHGGSASPAAAATATPPMAVGGKSCGQPGMANACAFLTAELEGPLPTASSRGANTGGAPCSAEGGKPTTPPTAASRLSRTPDASSRSESVFASLAAGGGGKQPLQSTESPSPSPSPSHHQLLASASMAGLGATGGSQAAGPVKSVSNSKLYATCFICHKQLSNQYNLRVHLETHQNMRYACNVCPHVSRSKDALRKHVSYRHPGAPSPCEQGRKRAASVAAKTLNAAMAAAATGGGGGVSSPGPATPTSPLAFPLSAGSMTSMAPLNDNGSGSGNEHSMALENEAQRQQQLSAAAYMFMPNHFQLAAAAAAAVQQQQQQQQNLQNLVAVSQACATSTATAAKAMTSTVLERQQNFLNSLNSEIKMEPDTPLTSPPSYTPACEGGGGITLGGGESDGLVIGLDEAAGGAPVVCKTEPQSASNTSSIST